MTDTELIKTKIDIVDFLSEYVTLKKAGRNFKANCPFHSEKTPSFIVSPERQSWHCFGACSMGGDIITYLQKWENIEFVEALNILAKRAGVTLSRYTPTETTKTKEKIFEINHLASEFYHFLLTKHKLGQKARDYLNSRRIRKESIDTFLLGYAPAGWDNLTRYFVKKGYNSQDLSNAGLIIKSESGRQYDRFRGRIMFTLKDPRGNIVGFSGRKLIEEEESGGKYINTPETAVYFKGNTLYGMDITREAIKRKKEAVVVEGEFDFLASWQSGVNNIVAIKGSALTENQALLLKRYTENIVLALDSDFAGNEAARRGIEIAEKANLAVRIVELPFGKDPAECIEKGAHLWKSAVEKAVPVYDFIINRALAKYNHNDAQGKKKIAAEVLPFIAKLQNPIVQSHYTRFLSAKLGVAEESIETVLRNLTKTESSSQSLSLSSNTKPMRTELLEEHLLSLLLQAEDAKTAYLTAFKLINPDDFNFPPVKTIMELLGIYFKKHDGLKIKEFGKNITPELSPAFDKAIMVDISHIFSKKGAPSKELAHACREIKKQSIRRRINSASTKMRQVDKNGEIEQQKSLNETVRQLLAELSELEKSD